MRSPVCCKKCGVLLLFSLDSAEDAPLEGAESYISSESERVSELAGFAFLSLFSYLHNYIKMMKNPPPNLATSCNTPRAARLHQWTCC